MAGAPGPGYYPPAQGPGTLLYSGPQRGAETTGNLMPSLALSDFETLHVPSPALISGIL